MMFDIELLVSPSKEADIRLTASMVINASYSQAHNSYQGKNIPKKQEAEQEVAEKRKEKNLLILDNKHAWLD